MIATPNIRPLSEELKKIAQDELNEVENRIGEDLAALQQWIKQQPHLSCCQDEQFLIAYLRSCKYSLEKAKSKIDYSHTIKTMMPEIFDNKRMDERYKDLCRSGTCIRLPTPLGEGGPRIQLINYSKLDPKLYTIVDHVRFQCMLMTWQMNNDDNFIISGNITLIDLSNISLAFLTQFDPILIKKLAVFADKGAPVRIKGVHVVNCPTEFRTVLNLGRSLMSQKLQQRFFVHKTMDDLHKAIPKMYLPVEYGGTNGTVAEIAEETVKYLEAFNDFFTAEDQYGVNEKLRRGRAIDKDSLFGLEGSFRKLDID